MHMDKSPGVSTLTMTLALALLMAGCGAEDPDANPIRVGVRNQSYSSIYVGANALPLRIKDSTGNWWGSDAGFSGVTCSQCDQQCDSSLHGDPAPTWTEIPSGQTLPLSWDGRLYERLDGGCHCGITCYQPMPFVPGKYTFEVSYGHVLPSNRQPYSSSQSHGGSLTTWTGSGMGTASTKQFRIFRLTYDGETEINLLFK